MPSRTQKVLIDCDPGHDDAIAIIYAASHLDLVGVTTVYGNQVVEKTTHNALLVLTLLGLDVPVAEGCACPLNRIVQHGADLQGKSGIDGADLPAPDRTTVDLHAVDSIIDMASRHRGELVLCPTGPFTNIAMALRMSAIPHPLPSSTFGALLKPQTSYSGAVWHFGWLG